MDEIDRRTFLALTGASSLALALPRRAAKRKLKKSLMFGMVEGSGSLLEKFTTLKEVGFEGVELDSPSDLHPEEVLEAMKKTGLEVSGMVDSVHWKDTL